MAIKNPLKSQNIETFYLNDLMLFFHSNIEIFIYDRKYIIKITIHTTQCYNAVSGWSFSTHLFPHPPLPTPSNVVQHFLLSYAVPLLLPFCCCSADYHIIICSNWIMWTWFYTVFFYLEWKAIKAKLSIENWKIFFAYMS